MCSPCASAIVGLLVSIPQLFPRCLQHNTHCCQLCHWFQLAIEITGNLDATILKLWVSALSACRSSRDAANVLYIWIYIYIYVMQLCWHTMLTNYIQHSCSSTRDISILHRAGLQDVPQNSLIRACPYSTHISRNIQLHLQRQSWTPVCKCLKMQQRQDDACASVPSMASSIWRCTSWTRSSTSSWNGSQIDSMPGARGKNTCKTII